MLKYEFVLKEFLKDKNIELKGIEKDGRILVDVFGIEHIYRIVPIYNTIRIYNYYYDRLYTIDLK